MKKRLHHIATTLAAATLLAGWSAPSLACSTEAYLGTICPWALNWGGGRVPYGFALANGAQLQVSQNNALFSLIGSTYGGDGSKTFNLPDLRGRFLLGAGQQPSGSYFRVGSTGGSEMVQLSVAQLPPHSHAFTGKVAFTQAPAVNLSAVTGNASKANLANVSFSATASGLRLMAASGGGNAATPGGNVLAGTAGPANKIYSNATPDATMAAASIGGTLKATIGNGSAPVTLAGSAPVANADSGMVTGPTSVVGMGLPVNTMPPYLAMNFYIAVLGAYPTSQ